MLALKVLGLILLVVLALLAAFGDVIVFGGELNREKITVRVLLVLLFVVSFVFNFQDFVGCTGL